MTAITARILVGSRLVLNDDRLSPALRQPLGIEVGRNVAAVPAGNEVMILTLRSGQSSARDDEDVTVKVPTNIIERAQCSRCFRIHAETSSVVFQAPSSRCELARSDGGLYPGRAS